MPFFHFPSEFVYWEQVNNHEKIKSELLPIIKSENEKTKNNPFISSKVNTSFYHDARIGEQNKFLHEMKFMEDIIHDPLHNMQKSYNELNLNRFDVYESIVRHAWWNVYEEGDFIEMRNHNGEPLYHDEADRIFYPAFSVVYILHDENETSDDFAFTKDGPLPFRRHFDSATFSTKNADNIKEGTVLIFPYNLKHFDIPCKKGRITINFEIYSTHNGPIVKTSYKDDQDK